MTQLRIISDIHLDGHHYANLRKFIPINENSKDEILLIGGDFINGACRPDKQFYWEALEDVAENFKHTVIIFGNHEHYKSETVSVNVNEFQTRYPLTQEIGKISFLENDHIVFEEEKLVIYGGTMWASFEDTLPLDVFDITRMVSDFSQIADFSTEVSKNLYFKYKMGLKMALSFKRNNLDPDYKLVVMSHFAPFKESIHQKYSVDSCNSYFANKLDLKESDMDLISLWHHGHCHDAFDYMYADKLRVVCNPVGYRGETGRNGFQERMVIKL